MFLWQAMIIKLLYYDQLLYTKWYGQEVYYYPKKQMVCLIGFKKKKRKQDSFKHHVHIFPISTAEPTAIMYLYRNLLIAKNCMVDGRLHEFCLSNCGSMIIQLHHLKKETLAFICTKASCKALFRCCRETCPVLDFLKAPLALTSSLGRRWVSEPFSSSVCDFQVVLARLWMWARTLRASFSNFISILGLKRSLKWHFVQSYLSHDCSDTVLWETCPSCLSRACAAHTLLCTALVLRHCLLRVLILDCFLPAEEALNRIKCWDVVYLTHQRWLLMRSCLCCLMAMSLSVLSRMHILSLAGKFWSKAQKGLLNSSSTSKPNSDCVT